MEICGMENATPKSCAYCACYACIKNPDGIGYGNCPKDHQCKANCILNDKTCFIVECDSAAYRK